MSLYWNESKFILVSPVAGCCIYSKSDVLLMETEIVSICYAQPGVDIVTHVTLLPLRVVFSSCKGSHDVVLFSFT